MLRKRKPISNQESLKRQKVDGESKSEELLVNWKKIRNYVKKLDETKENVKLVKNIVRHIIAKSVPEERRESQVLIDGWLEIIHYLIRVKEDAQNIQGCFKFLIQHKIGRKNAQLYLEWAEFVKNLGNFEKAKNIISLGIEYGAQPEQLLQSKLNLYQDRLNQNDSEQTYIGLNQGDDLIIKDSYRNNVNEKVNLKKDEQIDNKNIFMKEVSHSKKNYIDPLSDKENYIKDVSFESKNYIKDFLNEKENIIKDISFDKKSYIKDISSEKEMLIKDISFDKKSYNKDIPSEKEMLIKDISFNKNDNIKNISFNKESSLKNVSSKNENHVNDTSFNKENYLKDTTIKKENYLKDTLFDKENYVKDKSFNKEIYNKDTLYEKDSHIKPFVNTKNYLKDTSFEKDLLYNKESHNKDISFNKENEDFSYEKEGHLKSLFNKERYVNDASIENDISFNKELYNKDIYNKVIYNKDLYSKETSNKEIKKEHYSKESEKKELNSKRLIYSNGVDKKEPYNKDFYYKESYNKDIVYDKDLFSKKNVYNKELSNKELYNKEPLYSNDYFNKELSSKDFYNNDFKYDKELSNKELYNKEFKYDKKFSNNKEFDDKDSIFKESFNKQKIYNKEIYNKDFSSKDLFNKELYNEEIYKNNLNLKNSNNNILGDEGDTFGKEKNDNNNISKEIEQLGKELSILSSGAKNLLSEDKINVKYSGLKSSKSDDVINGIYSNNAKNIKMEKELDYFNTPLPLSQQKRNYSGSSQLFSLPLSPIENDNKNFSSNTNNNNSNNSNNNSSNSSNSILNSINTSSQNIMNAIAKSNIPSSTRDANSIYSTPFNHYNNNISPILSLSHSQPRSNYMIMPQNQRNNEEYVEPYSFEMPLNDVKSESYSLQNELNINQQMIDNIPRSVIQYIYSLLYRGSTIFTCNDKRYMSLEQIGRGGTSKVYKVLSQDGKILALKKIDINGSDKASIKGYVNEINLLNHLKNNSRIIQLVDSEINREAKSIYMVMECGEIDLAKLLQKEGKKISISSIKMYWEQMLKAVHAIHEENIIHSDLKPANFLLVGGALKLIDFGIAKAIPNDTTNIHRDVQTGTVNYMSPESISGYNNGCGDPDQRPDFKISRASDVWSLGCILYQMVYGKPPFFKENNIFMKFKAIVNVHYQIAFSSDRNQFQLESSQDQASTSDSNESKYNINNFVSSPLLEVMKLCLRRDPKERPTIPQLLQQAFIHAPQVSYNLVYNIVREMLNYCDKEDDVSKISEVLYEQIMKQGSF